MELLKQQPLYILNPINPKKEGLWQTGKVI